MTTIATDTTLPPLSLLAETAAELALAAQQAEDRRNANALNKAAYHLASGIRIVESAGDLLIPSATTTGQVYRVSAHGCTCQAGLSGAQCWHASLLEIVSTARERHAYMESPPIGELNVPTCCGKPMQSNGSIYECPVCNFWTWV